MRVRNSEATIRANGNTSGVGYSYKGRWAV